MKIFLRLGALLIAAATGIIPAVFAQEDFRFRRMILRVIEDGRQDQVIGRIFDQDSRPR